MKSNRSTRWILVSSLAISPAFGLAAPADVATPPAESLENLGDGRLMSELADRGLDSLLDRYFELHHTPEKEQTAVRSLKALHDLTDPNKKMTNSERDKLVTQVTTGINANLANLKDPVKLSQDANVVLEAGVVHDANLLEYWGENPATEAKLRPRALAAYNMLGKSAVEAQAQANAIASKLNNPGQQALADRWDKMDQLSKTSKYRQDMMAYFVAISTPKNARAKIADDTITHLKEFDNADSQVQPLVHLMIGKLQWVKGSYDEAIATFDSLINDPQKQIQPPANVNQLYEARYFTLVAKLQSGKVEEAKKGLEDLIAWQKTAMDKTAQEGVAAAAEMLRYRIFLGEADKTKDPNAKRTAEAAASDVLLKLSKDHPEFKGIIYQQLVERMPKDSPVVGMDPLLLSGLMAKAAAEVNKPAGNTLDTQALQRGLDAAKEVMNRKQGPGITPQLVNDAGLLVPAATESLGHKLEAANAYLKYAIENKTVHPQEALGALDDAGRLTFQLKSEDDANPAVADLMDRFLPVAVNPPFSKKQLDYFYAQRLRVQGKAAEAVKFFKKIDASDKNYANAQYYLMQSLGELLDNPKLADAERARLATDVMHQAEQVRQAYAGSKDDAGRERAAIATLTEAKVAGSDLKKPKQTLEVLDGFEKTIQGTPDEKVLLGDALLTRVNAYMAAGQLPQATEALLALLNNSGGAQGAEYVHVLLDRLDKDLDKAQAAHDTNAMRDIARSEADLSGHLVDWAKNNANAEIKKFTYAYMVFDARTKRLAGTLQDDEKTRQKLLDDAMGAYKKLQQPDNVALYKGTLDQQKIDKGDINPNEPDPNVTLGIALTNFELKNYKEASEALGTLLNGGMLGGPTLTQGAEQKVVDNDTYWDATYKLYRSNASIASGPTDAMLEGTKRGLKNLLVRGGIPAKWADKFEALRKDIIPDFDLAAVNATAASQPVSAASK